jgi:hypothetical protein
MIERGNKEGRNRFNGDRPEESFEAGFEGSQGLGEISELFSKGLKHFSLEALLGELREELEQGSTDNWVHKRQAGHGPVQMQPMGMNFSPGVIPGRGNPVPGDMESEQRQYFTAREAASWNKERIDIGLRGGIAVLESDFSEESGCIIDNYSVRLEKGLSKYTITGERARLLFLKAKVRLGPW